MAPSWELMMGSESLCHPGKHDVCNCLPKQFCPLVSIQAVMLGLLTSYNATAAICTAHTEPCAPNKWPVASVGMQGSTNVGRGPSTIPSITVGGATPLAVETSHCHPPSG